MNHTNNFFYILFSVSAEWILISHCLWVQGVLSGEQEWFIRISYQARCTSYAIVTGKLLIHLVSEHCKLILLVSITCSICEYTGLVICFILLSIKLNNWLQHHGEERYVMDDDSSIISLLVNKDDDVWINVWWIIKLYNNKRYN